jgi:peptide deformylase
MKYDLEKLSVIHYPDPRLRKTCEPITEFDDDLAALVDRMLELMGTGRGVGLAAPQVGLLLRMFVANVTGEDGDSQVFVNPVIRDRAGNVEAEEGCLSLPGIDVNVRRARQCRIEAQDLRGDPVEIEGEDLICRVWQHETDHLDGVLIIDRMGPSDRIATRNVLRSLEEGYADAGKHKIN